MLEFKLNIDISDRFENAIKTLADAIAIREKLQHESTQGPGRMSFDEAPEDSRQNAPESKETAKPTDVPPEYEKAQEAAKESKNEGIPAEVKVEEVPEPTTDPLAPADVPPEPQKKAPERVEEHEPTDVPPEPQKKAPERVEEHEPTDVPPEPEKAQEAAKELKSEGDPMQGMNLMQAVKAIADELHARGAEMSGVNARVRRRANELGLSYSSFTCLVKAIGYTEARRVALGE